MTSHPVSPWTEERDAELRRLWAIGWKTAAICRAMEMTRNQVLGRAHRLGLAKRRNPVSLGRRVKVDGPAMKRSPQGARRAPARPRLDVGADGEPAEPVDPLIARLRDEQPLRIDATFATELPPHQEPRGCRYISGSGAGWRFCQRPMVSADPPYCAAHMARCYRPAD